MTDRLKPCPLCGGKLTKDRWGIYEHEANDCILAYYEVYDEDLDKWNTRKPMERIVEELEKKAREPMYQHHGESYYIGVEEAIEIVKEGGKK